jgi:geranylgeranyl reductase family protein
MQLDFDVIVVGAGPAGCTTAYELNRLGYKVLLLDKCRFPRVKPCGGALSIKALNVIPWSVAPVLEGAVKTISVGMKQSGGSQLKILEGKDCFCAFAIREEFDRFNLEKTVATGVQFEIESGLTKIKERQTYVEVTFGRKQRTARYVVGADGANSVVRRLIRAYFTFNRGFAIEGVVENKQLPFEPLSQLFFGYVDNGYGWLFPKKDHVNVGLYTSSESVKLSKGHLRSYALDQLGTNQVERIVGFPIGFGGHNYSLNSGRIILVGDAGGFAEPLLGEGIYNALASGQAAAKAIDAHERGRSHSLSAAYSVALRPLQRDLACCDNLARRFYPNLNRIGFNGLGLTVGKKLLMRGFAAGMTMHQITNFLGLGPIRLLRPFYRAKTPISLREFTKSNVS